MSNAPWDLHKRHTLWGAAVFDPATLLATSLVATAVGGGVSAAGALAGGSAAAQAGKMQQAQTQYVAEQMEQNAGQAIASSQRTMLDTQEKTRLALSTLRARASSSGAAPDVGSPVSIAGDIAQRGSYHALMDMFNGESTATGLENQAKGEIYSGDIAELEGEEKEKASYLAAGGDVLSAIGSAAGQGGRFKYAMRYGVYGNPGL